MHVSLVAPHLASLAWQIPIFFSPEASTVDFSHGQYSAHKIILLSQAEFLHGTDH